MVHRARGKKRGREPERQGAETEREGDRKRQGIDTLQWTQERIPGERLVVKR